MAKLSLLFSVNTGFVVKLIENRQKTHLLNKTCSNIWAALLLLLTGRAITGVITITKLGLAEMRDQPLPSLPVVKTAIRNLLKITSPNTKLWDLVELKIAGYFSG